ncbi:MAG TPA: nicotinate-nucleotide adenylyltransferase [Candidatus Dormibacteraeota bacterium]|nr:nicotinate-nucleotide adenylyltransferase [Candidatus Dormibacteraeota bacterium]
MKIGILGGTFDPIHRGHLAAAHVAMECAGLDRVLFIPSATPPHREPALATPDQRLDMTRLAISVEPRFEVSDIEVKRGGRSYTVDTLRGLRDLYPHDKLYLILGWDAAKLFESWREPDEIRRLASVIVVTRPGSGPLTEIGLEAAGLEAPSDTVCEGETPDISASELRGAIAGGERVSNWLPDPVRQYIAEHGLYGDNRQVGC